MSRVISFCFQMRRIVPSESRCGSIWVAYPGNLLMVTDVDPCDAHYLFLLFFLLLYSDVDRLIFSWFLMWIPVRRILHSKSRCGPTQVPSHHLFRVPDVDPWEAHYLLLALLLSLDSYVDRIISSWFLMWIPVRRILHSNSRCGSALVASSLPGSRCGSMWGATSVAGAFSPQMWIHVITESHHLFLNSDFSPT